MEVHGENSAALGDYYDQLAVTEFLGATLIMQFTCKKKRSRQKSSDDAKNVSTFRSYANLGVFYSHAAQMG